MLEKIKNQILNSEKIAIFNHENPDGDAFGSAYALKLALCKIGKKAEVFLREQDYTAPPFSSISGTEISELTIEECDLKIAVDSSDIDRIGYLKEIFSGNTIAIDHHITHIPFAETTLVEPDASATGEIIYELIKYMNIEITKEIAHNLYISIASDTGSFKYSSTTPKTHEIVADLMRTGIDVGLISKQLFDTNSFEYYKMLQLAIGKVEIFGDGKIAILCLDKEFEISGLEEKDAGAIVTMPGKIQGVEISAYIRPRDDKFKVSLRTSAEIDVSKIASGFGGGGHIKAAGFSVSADTIEDAKKITLDALLKAIS